MSRAVSAAGADVVATGVVCLTIAVFLCSRLAITGVRCVTVIDRSFL